MRITVTGASGFIGSYTVKEALSRGWKVTPVDLPEIDVLGPHLGAAISGTDSVIHLAGTLGTSELFDHAEAAVDTNVKGMLRVLECCRAHGTGLVGIGMLNVWDNVYSVTKRAAERLAYAWHREYGVPVSYMIGYNVFGPGQDWPYPRKIVPGMACESWQGKPIRVYEPGTQMADLVWVEDVARMLCDMTRFGDCEVFDGGTGHGQTAEHIAMTINEITCGAGVEMVSMRRGEHGDHEDLVASGRGWDLLGWRPRWQYDKFAETVQWYRTHRP